MRQISSKKYALVIFAILFACCFVGTSAMAASGQNFESSWKPSPVHMDGSLLFESRTLTDTYLHVRVDASKDQPDPKTDVNAYGAALETSRTFLQKQMGFGAFRINTISLSSPQAGRAQLLLSAVYSDYNGKRTYLYEEQYFVQGKVAITQLSSPFPIAEGYKKVIETRNDYFKSKRSPASPDDAPDLTSKTEAEGPCLDCLEKQQGFFEKSLKDVHEAVDVAKSRERSQVCAGVLSEKKSTLSGIIGDTEYKSWDEQYNQEQSKLTSARNALSCLTGFGKDAASAFLAPWLGIGSGIVKGVMAAPGAAAALFQKDTWIAAYDKIKALPAATQRVVGNAASAGAVALSAARDYKGTYVALTSSLGRIINNYLVGHVPEYMCMTPEARMEMICGMWGSVVGNVVNPAIILKLLSLGKFAELTEMLSNAFSKVKSNFIREPAAQKAAVAALDSAKPLEAEVKESVKRIPPTIAAEKTAPAVAKAVDWADAPERADKILNISRYDQARVHAGKKALSGNFVSTLSKYKDPKVNEFLKILDATFASQDEADIQAAAKVMELLRAEKSPNFAEAMTKAIEKYNNDIMCKI